jgi:ribonuclease HI
MTADPRFSGRILIFADGAAKGNPGPGGWGSLIVYPDDRVWEIGGPSPRATNNQMELIAAIKGLMFIASAKGDSALLTDSAYVLQGLKSWVQGWMRRGWKTAQGTDVANIELWKMLYGLYQERKLSGDISLHYTRGHCGIPGNERVDFLADAFALRTPHVLFEGTLQEYGHPVLDIPYDTSIPEAKAKASARKVESSRL